MTVDRIRTALVGCGQIADAHLQQIRRISSAELVAVCDREAVLARQAAERFDVPAQFDDLDRMVEETRPDVVHVTTPVHTHAPLTKQLLSLGVHVYVEKPFTVDVSEAIDVLATARASDRLVCLGHDHLFDPVWLECRARIDAGEIGDVHHIDSVHGYPIDGPFGRLVCGDPNHWVRRLPGGLFQNTISHPLYRITEFLSDNQPRVQACWFGLQSELPFPTELRVQLQGDQVTGSLLFISGTKPSHRLVRIYGTRGGLEVDLNSQLIRSDRSTRFPGAFAQLEAPFRQWRESISNLRRNFFRFARGGFHYFDGMKQMFEQFYGAIRNGTPPPVSYDEALRVTELMDRIFDQCRKVESENNGHRGKQERLPSHSDGNEGLATTVRAEAPITSKHGQDR